MVESVFTKQQITISAILLFILVSYSFYDFHQFSYSIIRDYKLKITKSYFGFYQDYSDSHWVEYQENLIPLLLYAFIYLAIRQLIKQIYQQHQNLKIFYLLWSNILIGIIFLSYIHALGIIQWILHSLLFYLLICNTAKFKYFPFLLWFFCILVLYLNENNGGYLYVQISHNLKFIDDFNNNHLKIRWFILYNLSILRIISFGMDYYWSIHQKSYRKNEEHKLSLKNRSQQHHATQDYNLTNYLAYLLYSPLFVSGPILTFNAFYSQVKLPQQSYNTKQIIHYAIRTFLANLLPFYIINHLLFPNAISQSKQFSQIIQDMRIYQIDWFIIFQLHFIWFKYLCIWRIALLWALIDGIETTENMNRCVYNNNNFQGFWRSWHRSFNQWLIRYLFIPLGGSRYKLLNIWVIFSFVAIWHDFNLNLIVWAWGICIALIPEILVIGYFDRQQNLKEKWYYKWLYCISAILYVKLLMVVNMVAFSGGIKNMNQILDRMFQQPLNNLSFIISVFFAAMIQYQLRVIDKKNY